MGEAITQLAFEPDLELELEPEPEPEPEPEAGLTNAQLALVGPSTKVCRLLPACSIRSFTAAAADPRSRCCRCGPCMSSNHGTTLDIACFLSQRRP